MDRTSDWCKECRRSHETGFHSPLWKVWCPHDGEKMTDARLIRAPDAESAAERWAELDDAAGIYRIRGGLEIIVTVRGSASGALPYRFEVVGESVPQYTAMRLGS